MPAVAKIRARLLTWYDGHRRALPWRATAGARADPYAVWLSEIMLQQTTVPHATPYFLDFLRRWPTVNDLAAAQDGEVMAAWAGLGYYARARNLLACARVVAGDNGGVFPDTEDALRRLPGLGAYTASLRWRRPSPPPNRNCIAWQEPWCGKIVPATGRRRSWTWGPRSADPRARFASAVR